MRKKIETALTYAVGAWAAVNIAAHTQRAIKHRFFFDGAISSYFLFRLRGLFVAWSIKRLDISTRLIAPLIYRL